jgi:AcrR family transcriptional regulator
MAEIASAAGVGLDSIYRRWPAKPALLVDVVATAVAEEIAVPDEGSLARDLEHLLADLIRAANADLGRLLAVAIAEARHDPALAGQLAQAQARRRQATAVVVQRATERGELRAEADPQLLLDALAGVVWQRVWLAADPMSPVQAGGLVRGLLAGFVVPES